MLGKEVLYVMWFITVGELVAWGWLSNRMYDTDHSLLKLAAVGVVVPPIALLSLALVAGWLVFPILRWRKVRTSEASGWDLREYVTAFPTPALRLNSHVGWRRRLRAMTCTELADALDPYYSHHWDPRTRTSVPPPDDRTPHLAYRWLVAGLDPTLLVACLQAGLPDETIEAHRRGEDKVDEPAVRMLAGLRTADLSP